MGGPQRNTLSEPVLRGKDLLLAEVEAASE